MLESLFTYLPFLNYVVQVLKVIFLFLPFILPPALGFLFYSLWLRYKRTNYLSHQKFVLLEIKIPKEITKSPLAMEVFLTSLYQTGKVTYTDTYWLGKVKPWFSLEIVSIEGQVRFFIWSQMKYKDLIEAQIYGQYPDVEIQEADDYATFVKHDPKNITMWGTYYRLSEKDAYPIKTYVDYGLEKETEEEFKIDPMTAVIEFLGSIKKGEQVWIQILIQAHRKEGMREGRLLRREDWKKEGKKEIEKIRKEARTLQLDQDSEHPTFTTLTKGQQEDIASIERSLAKFPFDCMIRAFYIAKNESFNEVTIPGLIGSVRQYSSNTLNGFKLAWYTDHTDNGKDWINFFGLIFPRWLKIMKRRRDRMERVMLEAYKMRSFFHPPYRYFHARPFILTTEELATIYHFPGEVATTPTLERIPSRRARPPSNLPI